MLAPKNMLRMCLELNVRADDTKTACQNETCNVNIRPIRQLFAE